MPLSVADVNNYLKSLVDNDMVLSTLDVVGEVSNFKEYSASGQWYFTLKDRDAQLSCVVFAGVAAKLKYQPVDGDRLVVKGKLAIFNKRGTYNLQIFWLAQEGIGDLAKAFELLKQKLLAEGLFDATRKKELPRFPKKIVVLAAREGAAVHDVVRVARHRDTRVEIVVLPTVVQGKDAPRSIVANLARAVTIADVDLVLLARGGGALEDLLAFNEEQVARAIAACPLPTVSAIGHEVDLTIADMVADLRAPTPSAAIELIVPELLMLRDGVLQKQKQLIRGLRVLIDDQYQTLGYCLERMQEAVGRKVERSKERIARAVVQLEALNPLTILVRGYAVVEKNSKALRTIQNVVSGDRLSISLADGTIHAEVI